jgi:hypothetical protein
MPLLIKNIDAIARKKQRDVLFVAFHPENDSLDDDAFDEDDYDWEDDPKRTAFLAWLDQQGIGWEYCAPMASECGFGRYLGQVYIDLAMDDNDPLYGRLRDYLEYPDGAMRDENLRFYYLPLAKALENAHHDEPGFWERWAAEF